MGYFLMKCLRKLEYFYNCYIFDSKYYLNKYPDVAKSGMDPLAHYKKYGWREGRYNSFYNELENTMDCKAYLKRYPDVAKSGMDPILHYLRHGKVEGRIISNKDSINSCVNNSYLTTIKNSPYWDEGWYISYYREVKQTNIDPAMHYLLYGSGGSYSPGPVFNSREYLFLNPEVKAAHMNPLLHYEKFGWKEGRLVSLADIKEYYFPNGTTTLRKVFRARTSFDKHIVTVLASFSGNGKVADYVLYLIKGLREVSDYIILVCDNPLFSEEIAKLESVCDACICERHNEYDFGSYKRGIVFFEEQGIFTNEDELLLINDSNYGPVHPFVPVIERLHELGKDFCGLSANKARQEHIQSFFYLFSNKVYTSDVFKKFFRNVTKKLTANFVINSYEIWLTKILSDAGFTWGTLVPVEIFSTYSTNSNPTFYSLTLIKDWGYPVVKIKTLKGEGISEENQEDILEHIKQINYELYNIIIGHLTTRKGSTKRQEVPVISSYTLRYHYAERVAQLQEKCKRSKLKVIFLANMSSMFPAQGLMEKMLYDDLFDVELYAIPEVRFGNEEMFRILNETYKDLSSKYPFAKSAVEWKNGEITACHDVVKDADLVCYPSPYDVSFSLYNPYYAVQNNILSFYTNYGLPHAKNDYYVWQLYNYNNFWKVYLGTESLREEYRKHGRCEACNAEVVGYAKMDNLATVSLGKNTTDRKKIIIVSYYSIEAGTNGIMLPSNFQKYAELFLKLPEYYPEIDFIVIPDPAFVNLRRACQLSDEKWNEYLEKMCSFPNVECSAKSEYVEIFAKSDGIIQDCGPFLVEYFYTGKPYCCMLEEEADVENNFLDFEKEYLKHCYIAYKEEDIRRFLDEVIIESKDPKKVERENFCRDVVMLNYPCTDVILRGLKKEFTSKE